MSAISATTVLAIAGGIAGGAGAAYAGHKAASAAEHGADETTKASNYAADLSSKSNAASLAFEQQKDREAAAQFEATQKANYDQWAAKEARMNDIRQQLGMPAHDIPAYSSLTPPAPGGTPAPRPGGTPPPGGTPSPGGTPPPQQPSNLTDPSAWMSLVGNDPALKAWVTQGLGSAAQTPGLVDYYTKVIKGQPGANPTEQAGSAAYYMNKFAADPNVRGGAPAAGGPANSLASFLPSSSAGINSSSVRQLPYLNPNGDIYAPTVGSYLPQ